MNKFLKMLFFSYNSQTVNNPLKACKHCQEGCSKTSHSSSHLVFYPVITKVSLTDKTDWML